MQYRHRYYDPDLGRFMSQDPAGYDGFCNLYFYVNSSPSEGTDPMGLAPKKRCGLWSRQVWCSCRGFQGSLNIGYCKYAECLWVRLCWKYDRCWWWPWSRRKRKVWFYEKRR